MRAEIKTGLEEIKATELEANKKNTEPVKAMHVLTALQGRVSDVTHVEPLRDRYKTASTSGEVGGNKTLGEAFRQILGLEVLKLTVGSAIGLQKTSDRALWRSGIHPKWKKWRRTYRILRTRGLKEGKM
jgi:hypothetical protein